MPSGENATSGWSGVAVDAVDAVEGVGSADGDATTLVLGRGGADVTIAGALALALDTPGAGASFEQLANVMAPTQIAAKHRRAFKRPS